MTLLTIFSAPKPFVDPHISLIQRNAIRSWTLLGPQVEVLLMGNDEGVAQAAAELGVFHLPEVACNEKGVPYIGEMFQLARRHSEAPLLMVVNADILLFQDLLDTALAVQQQYEAFVLAGQRWDLDVTEPLDFSAGWEDRLRAEITAYGQLHPPAGSDYFLFSRQAYQEVPNFTIGRAGWDNWMIYQAVTQSWKAIDATPSITVAHQNHDYRHLPDGQAHYRHPESQRNVQLGGGSYKMYVLRDIPYQWNASRIQKKPLTWLRMVRMVELWLQPQEEKDNFRKRAYWKVRKYRARLQKDG
jgi:hypothetical protein